MDIKPIILAGAALLMGGLAVAVPAPADAGSNSAAEKASNQIIQPYVEQSWFSGNVLIADEKGHISVHSFGMADIANGTPNSRCTRFNIGSIAKHYTAVLVLQMIEQGQLSYDTPLAEFDLGIDSEIAAKVTIEHLVKHQAGFGDIFIPAYMDDPLSYDTLDKKVALLKGQPLLFEPGSDNRYSNYGYILLGAMLEKVTGKKFAELLNERLFNPRSV